MLWFNIADENGFNTIWRYFGWANQTLAVFTLWAITVYLATSKNGFWYYITLLPACFMTAVSLTFILVDKVGFRVNSAAAPGIGMCTFILAYIIFTVWKSRRDNKTEITNN